MTFSIIVVCLNAGDKLHKTIESILSQTESDYEIVVKDGGSTDGSVKTLLTDDKMRVYCEADTGIYDAMNQALSHAKGEYVCFLNCGDYFYDRTVLKQVRQQLDKVQGRLSQTENQAMHIFYVISCNARQVLWYSPIRCWMISPVTGICRVIRHVFMTEGCLISEDLIQNIKCGPIMNISCGVCMKQKQKRYICL